MKIINKTLERIINFKLDTIKEEFTEQDLEKITDLNLDYLDFKENNELFIFDFLKNFKNLESITLHNFYLHESDFKLLFTLQKIKSINFEICHIEFPETLLSCLNVTELSFVSCNINNYNFLYLQTNLESLTIINDKISVSIINHLKKLKYLSLSASKIELDKELYLPNIEYLSIDSTNMTKLDFINKLLKLKKLSLDDNQIKNNLELCHILKNKGVSIYLENIIPFEGVEDYANN